MDVGLPDAQEREGILRYGVAKKRLSLSCLAYGSVAEHFRCV